MKNLNYNPDVLTCLANLSNDEVFTFPSLVNEMLDMLPGEIWSDKNIRFLDPAVKTGVFLREITKRLMEGLRAEIPDEQERRNHIFKNQVFGIALTELTSLLSKRSLYCSKTANGKYSICEDFKDGDGNISFYSREHTWVNGSCIYCGANKNVYERDKELEKHAYNFIHPNNKKEEFDMKFDVIIGNPPYQLRTGASSAQATPLYDRFVRQAKKLNPRFLVMIIPGRWYAGGMGLDSFREEMLNDARLRKLVDFPNAGDCFPGIELRGGVCYFLWDRDHPGECEYTNVSKEVRNVTRRKLSEYPIFIRWNQALNIVHKVQRINEESLSSVVSAVSPFGLATSIRGHKLKTEGLFKLYSSKGISYINPDQVPSGKSLIDRYKVLLSRPISGNLEVPPFKVISLLKTMAPKEVCTHTYLVAGSFDNQQEADNLRKYLMTRFVRFLLVQSISGIDISRDKFRFVPTQDFHEEWTDEKLFSKYKLSKEETDFIESMIKEMR